MSGCVCDPLHKIPWEIAKEMVGLAAYASWHASNTLAGKKGDAAEDLKKADLHYKQFMEFGLPTEKVCLMFKDMAWAAAWSTAHERMGEKSEAASNKARWEEKCKEIVASGEIDAGLANDLKELCWYSGWHSANTRKFLGLFHRDDAQKDAERVEALFQSIGGDCRLVCIDFIQDRCTLINPTKPKFFAEQKLENKSDSEQEMSCSFKHWNTQTKSWSTSIKWKFTVAGAIAGLYFVAGGIMASVSYSKETTEGGSITDGEEKTYNFNVKVGPKSMVTAKGIVQEATAEVPYFMIFDIGGKRYCKEGLWSGIVAGRVEYEIGETIPLD
ncbi:uncharacterized protein LOC124135762 [Haliotis rufescens]|uniref:uncharacterized protein LOC124135762 n=1 Tax=Haliotis rufescens TaxID=6454 RepID=UPI001EB05CF0|nr:uncharacterized protein LOC124135762 [Haliotis rufescens]